MKKNNALTFTLLWLAALFSAAGQTTLTKMTTGQIVTDTGAFAFFAWGDFRNSGLLDLVVCNNGNANGTPGTNLFYRNMGAGQFTKITQGDPVADADFHVGAAVGDYDNDGNLDLATASGINAPTGRRIVLDRGNGDGTFTRESAGVVTNQIGYFGACSWVDYDNDGFLDLCANDDGTGRILLFHSLRDGSFAKVTSGSIVTDVVYGAPVWADYDNDGFQDLLVPQQV